MGQWIFTCWSIESNVKIDDIWISSSSLGNSFMGFPFSFSNKKVGFCNHLWWSSYVILFTPSGWDIVSSGYFDNFETRKWSFNKTITITSWYLSRWAGFVFCFFQGILIRSSYIQSLLTKLSLSPILKIYCSLCSNWCAWGAVAFSFCYFSIKITSLDRCWISHNR